MVKLVTYIPQNEQPPRGAKTSRSLVSDDVRIKLIPGSQELTDSEASALSLHFFAKVLKKQGALIINETQIETSTQLSLKDLESKEAIALVGQTTSLDKLKTWQKDEPGSANRKTVLNAIAIQIEKIEKGKL